MASTMGGLQRRISAGVALAVLTLAAMCAVVARGEVSIMDQDDTCDMCVLVANAMDKSFHKFSSHSTLDTGIVYNPDGTITKSKRVKYNKSETRLLEVLDSVCPQMDEYRTNYWDPFQPKFVRRDKDIKNEDGKTQQEFVQTRDLKGNSPAELLLAFKKQMAEQFGDRMDDAQELRRVCGRLLEELEEDIEDWYSSTQDVDIKEALCVESVKKRFNYSCCVPEYPETLPACEDRERRKEELEKKIKEPQVAPVVEEEELPPGQIRDEKGVIWQLDPNGKNPFADWAPPSLGPNQIMDESGVIWQVEADSQAMHDYHIRMAKKKREMEKKAKEWEALRHPKEKVEGASSETAEKAPKKRSSEEETEDLAMKAARKLAEEENPHLKQAKKGASDSAPKAAAAAPRTSASAASPSAKAVRDWCDSEGLSEYADALVSNGYDSLSVVAALTKEDLIEIGIELPGHRKKILLAASKLSSVSGRDEL
eukprot:m.124126 g.124126  ORF g.124126 m.124126 type:complete len:481 (+) comp16282_c0_seq1:111-1553(+)